MTKKRHDIQISDPSEDSSDIKDLFHTLKKRKWMIVFSIILFVGMIMGYTYKQIPVYQASCTLMIGKDKFISPITGEEIELNYIFSQAAKFKTHSELIKSSPVLERLIERIDIAPNPPSEPKFLLPKFFRNFIASLKKNIKLLLTKKTEADNGNGAEKDTDTVNVDWLRSKIIVQQVGDTSLFRISVRDENPQKAQLIANSLIKTYIDYDKSLQLKSSEGNLEWLTSQLIETKNNLEEAEKKFQEYKQNEQLFSIEGKQNVILNKIQTINNSYLETRNRRVELESKLKALNSVIKSGKSFDEVRSIINNPIIDNLLTQLVEYEIELNQLGRKYKSKHPKIIEINAKIEKTNTEIMKVFKKEIESLKTLLSVTSNKEQELKKTIEDFENDALSTNKKEFQYSILQRNVEMNRRLYDALLAKVEETNILDDFNEPTMQIIEEAKTPTHPIKPNKKRNLTLSVILGIISGCIGAYLIEILDRSLKTENDVKKYLNLPVISITPKAKNVRGSVDHKKIKSKNKKKIAERYAHIIDTTSLDNKNNMTGFHEAFRTLSTNIHFLSENKRNTSFLITSAIEGEGKTITATNMAKTMAAGGNKVLLVDTDLRNPVLSDIFEQSDAPGLTDLLMNTLLTEIDSGNIEEFSLTDLIHIYRFKKRTGILLLEDNDEAVEFIFIQGIPRYVRWVTRPPEKQLVNTLIENALINEEQARFCQDRKKVTNEKLIHILLNMGFITEEQLKPSLSLNILESLRIVAAMKKGTFSFTEKNDDDLDPPLFEPVNITKAYSDMKIRKKDFIFIDDQMDKIILDTDSKNLFFLPSGSRIKNVLEMASSPQMEFFISFITNNYDYVIFDSSPLMQAPEVAMLSSYMNGVLLVVRAGKVDRRLVKKTIDQLQMANSDVFGVILNDVDLKSSDYYYSSYNYYRR